MILHQISQYLAQVKALSEDVTNDSCKGPTSTLGVSVGVTWRVGTRDRSLAWLHTTIVLAAARKVKGWEGAGRGGRSRITGAVPQVK